MDRLEGREWLEPDGLGGFASGTASGVRTRRYHALLLAAVRPPTDRYVLVNGFDADVEIDGHRVALSTQRYAPGVDHPDGAGRIASFEARPWPTWRWRVADGVDLVQELFVAHGSPVTAIRWTLRGRRAGTLFVRPFLSGRDYHGVHRENPAFRFEGEVGPERVTWRPYPDVPAIEAHHNGEFEAELLWYRDFLYTEERDRGLDHVEDLASPGLFRWDLSRGQAVWIVSALPAGDAAAERATAAERFGALRARELARRQRFTDRLDAAADAYLVRRGTGKTIVAGYPWFTDWGRDTFIALRGLCLATGRLDDATEILTEWADAVSEGMLPNRFPDSGEAPEYNSVDASLWYVVAVGELLDLVDAGRHRLSNAIRAKLRRAVGEILDGYARGTRFGIALDEDGLVRAGVPGAQLTWMDAKVGDWVVTPRIGKPVEIQALWLNALLVGARFDASRRELFERGRASFEAKYWNGDRGALFDVVDVDHIPGKNDPALRPNQIFAVGGLPVAVLRGERAREVVDVVERELLTPIGLRSLAPGEPGYSARYAGGPLERDGAYHQGTVWPWLLGAFVEAWVRVRGGSAGAVREARSRFLEPLERHLESAGMGHVSEIVDAEPPHSPGGCPFQAWSVGELLRLHRVVLAKTAAPAARPRPKRPARRAAAARS